LVANGIVQLERFAGDIMPDFATTAPAAAAE
jgi:hypothetical protein